MNVNVNVDVEVNIANANEKCLISIKSFNKIQMDEFIKSPKITTLVFVFRNRIIVSPPLLFYKAIPLSKL